MKALAVPVTLGWSAFIVCLLTKGWIETAALHQPRIADGMFRHPHQIKSGIRYLTDLQDHIYTIASPAMLWAMAVSAVLSIAFDRLRCRRERELKQRTMDKIANNFEETLHAN